MRTLLIAVAAALTLCGGIAYAAEPTGIWLSESGQTKVQIAPCGGAFCGTVVWVADDTGDVNNPDPALQGRSLVGIQMIYDMVPDGDRYRGRSTTTSTARPIPARWRSSGTARLSSKDA